MKKVFIDAGHGGTDPGAIGNRLREKDLTLAITLKIRGILEREYEGHVTKLSRTTDTMRSLKYRTNMANSWGANLLVSVHINAGGGTGFESFIYKGIYSSKAKTTQLQSIIHREIVKETGFKDRGKKQANFHMLRDSAMSAILTESGFIDHSEDSSKLRSDAFLNRIARGHTNGIVRALDLKKKGENDSNRRIHIVQKGDTLWGIAQKNNITLAKLRDLNPNAVPERLQIGQRIRM